MCYELVIIYFVFQYISHIYEFLFFDAACVEDAQLLVHLTLERRVD